VLGLLGKRPIELVVLFFALYAFVFVPLGRRTGFEHAKAILDTPAAKDAGSEILDAADRLRRRLLGGGASEPPSVPKRARPGAPDFGRHDSRPIPQVLPAPLADGPDASL
jgi:hypothetical protein